MFGCGRHEKVIPLSSNFLLREGHSPKNDCVIGGLFNVMNTLGSQTHPLRVAIIGSGPSGFYAAEHLQKQNDAIIEIDMFDRLPTPYGLVRGGVAPDHQKIKMVAKTYEKIADCSCFRFFGNVAFGTDITRDDLLRHYHAIIYAVGSQTDRKLDIPGEDLPGVHSATEFVGWYNAHPDYRHLTFDLSQETAVVVGMGNVAIDVARILARSVSELARTDIADYALEALAKSRVKTIYILGRRGPVQAAFTSPELKEFGELEMADVVVSPAEVSLDPLSQAVIDKGEDKEAVKNFNLLHGYADNPTVGKPRKVIFRFLVSPTEITGTDRVEAVRITGNELRADEQGNLRPYPTGQTEPIPTGLVFRAVGYKGTRLPGVPFYEAKGIIPNDKGRVLTAARDGRQVIGDYVVGWSKRGPSGIIGTNRPDAAETVAMLFEDLKDGRLNDPARPEPGAVQDLLDERGVRYFTFEDWQVVDQAEIERGQASGRPRLKFNTIDEMEEAAEGLVVDGLMAGGR
jgi:ferredoxin--NADP+ reductase